ncbi:DUF4031 domain-containing protein [Microbacterium panaciterrae]|uniref:DUF4031 domain-containing protein n=1 Tax=Microbacterium panaciterrae TaxID=985759 RepID=A0ABP8PME8_9MICO
MAILVDDAVWPAHGRLWAHLVSDAALDELHAFASAHDIPPRAFDLDHYDVPADALPRLLAGGARHVGAKELTRALIASGLRIPARDRAGLPDRHRR